MIGHTQVDFNPVEDLLTVEVTEYKLVVFNDDFNTFEHVIQTLVNVCGHEVHQAEQCTLIIHYKGKCVVKTGDWEKMAGMRNKLCDEGISAEVLE